MRTTGQENKRVEEHALKTNTVRGSLPGKPKPAEGMQIPVGC